MTLAEQLVALCKEHSLNALSVDVHFRTDGEPFFGAYAHREGKCGCTTQNRTNPQAAIGEAIADVLMKVGVTMPAVSELEAA